MEKEICVLPMHEPCIACVPSDSALFSIIPINDYSKAWLFHNYIQLFLKEGGDFVEIGFCSMKAPWAQFEWKMCPFIDYQAYNRKIIDEKYKDICDFFKVVIKNKYYIFFNTYRLEGFRHEVFISGYDDNKKCFLCWDFWNGYFKSKWISYDEIQKIYERMEGKDDWMRNAVITISSVYDIYGADYEEKVFFGKDDFKANISYWINRDERRNNAFLENKVGGNEIYDKLIKVMLDFGRNFDFNKILNRTAFHHIVEHMKIVSQAYKYVYGESGKYSKEFEDIVKMAKNLELGVVYIMLCDDLEKGKKRIYDCIEIIKQIKKKEMTLYKLIL